MTVHPRTAGLQGRKQQARALVRALQGRVEATRATSPSVDAAFVAHARDRQVGGNLLASAIAYRIFLWLLPLALLLAAVLGYAEASGDGEPEALGKNLGLGSSVVGSVATAAEQAEGSRLVLLLLALFGLYTAGAAGAKTVVAVHRFAWGMPPARPRGGPRAAVGFSGLVVGTLLLTFGAQFLRARAPGIGVVVAALIVLAYTGLWLGASILLPHGDASWPHLLPGAVLVGVGGQVMHLVSVFYLTEKIERSSELYGGLGLAATMLLGLYLVSRLVVASAILNATLWSQRMGPRQTGAG